MERSDSKTTPTLRAEETGTRAVPWRESEESVIFERCCWVPMRDKLYLCCDLRVHGAHQVCDLFNGPRPDLAIVTPSKIVVGELTVCHATNLLRSRDYKLQKYSNLGAARAGEFRSRPVLVHTVEVSTLGFVVAEPNFFRNGGIQPFDPPLLKEVSRTAILASRSIYCNR